MCVDEDRLTVEQARDARARFHDGAVRGPRPRCRGQPGQLRGLAHPAGFPDPGRRTTADARRLDHRAPTTPTTPGSRLAEAFGSSLLTVEGTQHTIVAAGTNVCVADHAAAHLVDWPTSPAAAGYALGLRIANLDATALPTARSAR